jgi:competence protein ComGC
MWSQNCESCADLLQLVQEQLQLYELGEERKKERKKESSHQFW